MIAVKKHDFDSVKFKDTKPEYFSFVSNFFMPVISVFYGLIVSMYYLDSKRHHIPHIHVNFGELEAVYSIPEGICLEGKLTIRKEKLVLKWILMHEEELMENWNAASNGLPVKKIKPLD